MAGTSTFESQCGSGHKFRDMFSVVAKCVFNICSKNFCSETNSTIHKSKKRKNLPSSKQSSNAKKIVKLPAIIFLYSPLSINYFSTSNYFMFCVSGHFDQIRNFHPCPKFHEEF